jgi:hypothetical protein
VPPRERDRQCTGDLGISALDVAAERRGHTVLLAECARRIVEVHFAARDEKRREPDARACVIIEGKCECAPFDRATLE